MSVVDCELFSSANRHGKVGVAMLMQASAGTKPPCDFLLLMFLSGYPDNWNSPFQ